MHWVHWVIVIASLVLTFTAWKISSKQIAERAASRYERETAKIVDLVQERMQRYEDALWAGATHIAVQRKPIDYRDWAHYANGIGIERKYPGINGIGVIHAVSPDQLDSYLRWQRIQRPTYSIGPEHDNDQYWPISYIIPLRGNEEAVGLDIAHERNRLQAAQAARDTGAAQISGPIILVQDDEQTPGFLFYVPFYEGVTIPPTLAERREKFVGLVYSPFVVRKLVDGVLSRERRNISFSIRDGATEIFTENLGHEIGYDPNPAFQSEESIRIYGRTWTFAFRSSLDFRKNISYAQPTTILVGGIFVDLLLLALFVQFSRNNQQAKQQARSLAVAHHRLEQANEELSQFNYRTSHDLVAPLKTIQGYVDLALSDLEEDNAKSASEILKRIDEQAKRLDQLVSDLLNLCRVDREDLKREEIDPEVLFQSVKNSLIHEIRSRRVELRFRNELTVPFLSQKVRIQQILENLISNGVKYSDQSKDQRWVKVRFLKPKGKYARIEVSDNGIGIPESAQSRVFDMFYRAGNNSEYGSGLGNYLVKKHVNALHGHIHYESAPGAGTCFIVDIPNRS